MYEAETAHANKLIENMSERDLFCKVKVVGDINARRSPEDGVYIVMGHNEIAVKNTAFNTPYMIEEFQKQDIAAHNIYPKCTIYKLKDSTLATASEFCNKRDQIHLMNELFKRYKLKVPDEISQSDFLSVTRAYYQSIDEEATPTEQKDAKAHLEYLLKILDSGLYQDEYDKKNGKFSLLGKTKLAKKIEKKAEEFANKTVTYEPKAKNCVSDEDLKTHGGIYKSVNVDHDILPYFEKEMEKYPNIKYSIVKESKPYIYGGYGYKYWHMVTFPVQSEKIVAGIMHKYERELNSIAKKYTPGRKNIFGVEIAVDDFDQFYEYACMNNIEFFFDEKSVYTKTTTDRIGIVTEDEYNRDLLVNALTGFVKAKLEGTYLDRDPVYIKQQEIKDNIEAIRRGFEQGYNDER